MEHITFQALKKNLKKDFSALKTIKVAVLGDSATQMYVQAIKGYGYELGINFDVFEADYDQVELQVYDGTSELNEFKPDYVVIFYCTNKLLKKFGKQNLNDKANFAREQLDKFENLYQTITAKIKSKVIFFNFNEADDAVFGNYANKTSVSFVYQLRKINFELMNLAQKHKNLFILDMNMLQARYGNAYISDNKIYINTDLLLSIDFLPVIAKSTIDIIQAISGKFKKCLVLDLDNTIWGGIIGDDGLENIQIGDLGIGKAFSELQLWAKQLKQRGIILAVCSKNDEAIAKEPFEKHPDMVLHLDDIAIFMANWENKADNIREIQTFLNIGFESMVFLDDSPFERNLVKQSLPQITVPDMPEDPADYLEYLYALNLFETVSFSAEDAERTKKYQANTLRLETHKFFTNLDEYLQSLNMRSIVEPFNKFNIPRVSQLTQRSNQFNVRTIRYSEAQIEAIANSEKYYSFTFTLEDSFGDNGLVCVVILEEDDKDNLFIDSWLMSCRILKRGMEQFVLNTITNFALEKKINFLVGEYLPTAKNELVKDHYSNLGFDFVNGKWLLDLKEYKGNKSFITIKAKS